MIRFKVNDSGIEMKVSEATPIYKEGGGANGATFYPSVSPDGVLSWKNDKGLQNPEPVNIKGQKGDPGYTPKKGVDYFDGEPGTSVTVKSVSTSAVDGGENVVTFSDGKTLTVRNGTKGGKGDPGASVSVASVRESTEDGGENVVTFSDGKTLSVRNGSKGGKGDPGDNYVLTEADKTEIADIAISKLPVYNGEVSEV